MINSKSLKSEEEKMFSRNSYNQNIRIEFAKPQLQA